MFTVRDEMRTPARRPGSSRPGKRRAREACVEEVWARERGRCQHPACRRDCVRPKDAYSLCAVNVGHVHEEPPRSLGGDPTDPDQCVLLCNECHERRHRRKKPWLTIRILDAKRGTTGPMEWEYVLPQKTGKTLAEIFAEEAARGDDDDYAAAIGKI